jgi:hypothetical protein
MLEIAEKYLHQIKFREGATTEEITTLQKNLNTVLPADYLDFLRYSNGGIGHGPELFVILDHVNEVATTTEGYAAPEFAPGLAIFGSDGCGNLLGIDTRNGNPETMEYVFVDPYSMDWEEIGCRTTSLSRLLEYVAKIH